MDVDAKLAGEFQSAIDRVSDILDGLADFGIVMINLSDRSMYGRHEWIDKHLKAIRDTVHDISLLVTNVGDADLLKPARMLVESTARLVNAVSQAAVESQAGGIPECTCQQMVENWNGACEAVSSIASLLGFGAATW